MKYIILILGIIGSLPVFSQPSSLEGVSVNITLRAGDWAFVRGSVDPEDSLMIVYDARLRDTIRLANPANFNTTVRFTGMPARIVYRIYVLNERLPAVLYKQNSTGSTINTAIKAITSTPLQNALTEFDVSENAEYLRRRTRGKNIYQDN